MDLKKNILDLNFQKHLIIASTAVITILTFILGLAISLITEQIILNF